VKGEEMKKLERELQADLRDAPEAVLNRVRDQVKEFLHEEASRIAGKRVRSEADIMELIHLHSRVALLRRVIEAPHQFNTKDLKELFRDTAPVADLEKKVDPLALVSSLDISGEEKAKVIKALADTARANIRAELGRGKHGTQG
jgi:hypothetical protein